MALWSTSLRAEFKGNGIRMAEGVGDCYPGERWDVFGCKCVRDCPNCSNIACSVKQEDKGEGM